MEFHEAVAELDTLVQTLEREGDERALMLLELVDAIHRPALALIAEGKTDHPLAQALLAMYSLADADEETLAEEALDEIRPYVESHGGEVELLSVEDGVVRVLMSGACQGCAGSAITLKRGIEASLREHLPGFREVVAEEPLAPSPQPLGPQLLQIEDLRRPVFVEAGEVGEAGDLRSVEADGVKVLLANVDGEVYAFKNGCAVDGLPLEGGRLADEGVLVCPWHNCAYDARSGKRVDDPDAPGLPVVPVALDGGSVRVAVNVA
jgi:Fe-S cluster biogenesis protein NfuA/nitrite reductase/ring-hydroxylating ferredoxin subunit